MKSRYIPITQQQYCCAPACLQMVMQRLDVPMIEQEDIAYEMGLAVPKEEAHLFKRVRSTSLPSKSWGTRNHTKRYCIDNAFNRLNVPIKARYYLSEDIISIADLKQMLEDLQVEGVDILIAFSYHELWGGDGNTSHVCVFNSIEGTKVHLIDPDQDVPKYRTVYVKDLFRAIKVHENLTNSGLWLIERSDR